MIRLFVLMHDCSHHSLFRTKWANDWVGFWLGTLFLTPHREWRRSHAIHHATSNCLERRNTGDIYTMTEAEYLAAPRQHRWAYRIVRHPLVMLGLGPIAVFLVKQRVKGSLCEGLPRGRRFVNVHATTVVAITLAAIGCYLLGTNMVLTIWGLSFWLAGAVGIFLFYMQHNFDGIYYAQGRQDFSFDLAGVEGASFFDLPAWAHWCTGNIGYHHIHHLDPLIPNYRLPACHRALFNESSVKHLSVWEAVQTLRLKLLLPEEQRMITWHEFRDRQNRPLTGGLTVMLLLLVMGCGKSGGEPNAPTVAESPLRAMNALSRKGDWPAAWKFADAVLLEHADDPEVLVKVARVAYENQHLDKAADLLADANRVEEFKNPQRVQQAMVAMIAAGRLFDGIGLLDAAIEKHPQQQETRRWLFDFLIGTENRQAALPHGRLLVKQRKFDIELLLSLSNTEQRTLDSVPLNDMLTRKPDDPRPLIGKAKTQFDGGLLSDSVTTLRTIIAKYPDDPTAHLLLGQALATSGQYDQLDGWLKNLPGDCSTGYGYWLTLGDWARSENRLGEAARAYWEATKCDADIMECWSKLSATARQLPKSDSPLLEEQLESIDNRAALLSRFQQLKTRFVRSGSQSRATVVEIVNTLGDLGRLWEAEAWAAIATTLPDEADVAVDDVRQAIIKRLRADTPWQLIDAHPELQLSLTSLPLPSFAGVAKVADRPNQTSISEPLNPLSTPGQSIPLRLVNEALQRGIDFYGRTGDHLTQPGIPLYQTLGCGGGTIDFDLDGWPDLYLLAAGGVPPTQDSASNALLRNQAGIFVDVTSFAATGDRGFSQGVAVGDVNEDGFADLLVLNYGPNRLYINHGDGTFGDASAKLDEHSQWSTCGAIADINGDALSDMVIVNYCAGLEPVTKLCPMVDGGEARSCSPIMFAADADVFLAAINDGQFIDQTAIWHAQPSVLGRGLGITVGTFDAEPGLDVLIANDMTTNHFWSRADGAEFQLLESAMPRGLAGDGRSLAQGSMGIATADFDRDGDIDFYVTNFENEYNTLYEQRAAGVWQDQTVAQGLASPTLPLVGFGTAAIDLDNDGQLELVLTNGHVDLFQLGDKRSVYAQPMQVFQSDRDGKFTSVGETIAGEYLQSPHVGRALWSMDANRDGLTDAVVTHQTEPVALLINQTETKHHFIEFSLVGIDCARDAIGAMVTIASGEQVWAAPLVAGDGYQCSSERVVRFGLGERQLPVVATVRWPDGLSDIYGVLQPDRRWLLVQHAKPFSIENVSK